MAKKKSKKNLIILIIAVVVIGGLIAGLVLLKGGNDLIIVSTEKVKTRTITQRVSAVGRIQPELTVKISSETSGEIIFLAVREGDTVRRGDLLVRIKPDIFETRLEQYEAAAEASKMEIDVSKAEKERSKGDLSRVKELYQKEFASKEELDRKNAAYIQAASRYSSSLLRYEQSLASLKEMQRNAERSTIFAPQAGIVTRLNVESGEKVVGTAQMAGTEMMIISDLSRMNAEVEVDENDIILVSIGDTCEIEIDAFPDSLYTGEVIEIGHSAMLSSLGSQDQVTNFKVTIRLSDIEPRLRPGMSCNVDIETETHENIVALPLQAVTVRRKDFKTEKDKTAEEDGEDENAESTKDDDKKDKKKKRPPSIVFVVDGNIVVKTEVKTGLSDKGYIEIKSGIEEGQEVVSGSFMAVSKQLYDSASIKVKEKKKKRRFGKKEEE